MDETKVAGLKDDEIEGLRKVYGKVGVIDWDGHQLVFRRPTREMVRDYRRKGDSAAEKPDREDQLSQQAMISFDGDTDPVRCREKFTSLLDEYPMLTSSNKYLVMMALLLGMVEEEGAEDLGKGVRVRTARLASLPKVSPNGSGIAPVKAS